MKLIIRIFALSLLALAGCASTSMEVIPQQVIQPAKANESQIVFMRSSLISSVLSASLYEVRGDRIEFLGMLNNDTKIAIKTTPGEHFYMLVSNAADFLAADLAPGKTYYAVATPRIGGWKPRFWLWPFKNDPNAEYNLFEDDLAELRRDTALVTISEAALAWYQANKAQIEARRVKYLQEWYALPETEKAKHSLQPSDGL